MTKRNPKQSGTNLYDAIPQAGKCPHNCSNCFFNRPGAFYTDTPSVPTIAEVGDGIVRMNSGNDSNYQRKLVVDTAAQFRHVFFNTSVGPLNFPGPVVLTANPREEEPVELPFGKSDVPVNLMFVRLRVSATNLKHIDEAVPVLTAWQVPVVLTFMAFYDHVPTVPKEVSDIVGDCYEWKVRHINSYWCPTKAFMRYVLGRYNGNRLVSMCGSVDAGYCQACLNCESYYHQTTKRMLGD